MAGEAFEVVADRGVVFTRNQAVVVALSDVFGANGRIPCYAGDTGAWVLCVACTGNTISDGSLA